MASAEETVPTINFVRAKYVESVTSIHSLKLDMTATLVELQPIPEGAVPPGLDPTVVKRERYLRAGNKVARSFEFVSRSGNGVLESWSAFDGSFYSRWQNSIRADPGREQLPQGVISDSRPSDLGEVSIETLTGAHVFPDQSFDRLLQAAESRVVGLEDVNGRRCVRVELAPFPPYPNHDPSVLYHDTVWFDPAAGYLPRLVRVRDSSDPKGSGGFEVFEFAKFETSGGLALWLPSRGVFRPSHGYNEWQMEFSNIGVNEPIPDQSFRPEFPFATYVADKRPGAPNPRYYVGGETGEKKYQELNAAHQAAREQLKAAAESGDGTLLGLNRGTWIATVGAIVLIAVGCGVCHRRRSRHV